MASFSAQREAFELRFGSAKALTSVAAPGRVNLIGEHTDYHQGLVLPAAIERFVWATGKLTSDDRVRLHSRTFGQTHTFHLTQPMGATSGWARRAEGIFRLVCEQARTTHGADVLLDADLPVGGGLSSSAASMAAVGRLAAELAQLTLEPRAFARLLQHAEHELAGVKCGLMDPLAVLLGKQGHALFIDCRSLEIALVPLPTEWALVVLDSGVRHELATSEYNQRQVECAEVLAAVGKRKPTVRSLRDVTNEDLDEVADALSPKLLRRARHVLSENARVVRTRELLATKDTTALHDTFAASHLSLGRDYQVSCRELDLLVEVAHEAPGFIAGRMTGGGFGGCTVNLVQKDQAEEFIHEAMRSYRGQSGREGSAIATGAADGVRVEKSS